MSQIVWQENIAVASAERVQELYESGKYLQAYRAAEALGPLRRWPGSRAKVLAGRLAMNLGAPRLGRRLHISAWRQAPHLAEARYYYARVVLERRGPLRAWQFVRQFPAHKPGPLGAGPGERPRSGASRSASGVDPASWLALHSSILCSFRDFDRADSWMKQAEEIGASDPWIAVERSFLLRSEDRYEEALEAANRSLELRPWFRPGVQAAADLLVLLNQDQEALGLLQEASHQIESGWVLAQLAVLQTELGLYADARQSYQRFAELSPLLEKEGARWLAARRSDVAYYLGDFAEATEWANQVEEPFYTNFAKALHGETAKGRDGEPAHARRAAAGAAAWRVLGREGEKGRRVQLDVPFVRQHHLTCAPATLAAISRFWNMPVQHLELAEAICYDGTPDHRERHWAEEHGWHAREFTVTWDSARALIDGGLPFTLTTTEPANSHLQAVIGYDTRRGTLLIRDPTERHFGEFDCQALLLRFRSTGPRGMVVAPRDRAGLLDGAVQLPDASQYDQLHRLQRALEGHDRIQADQVFEEMKKAAPRHRLTLHARWLLAHYDCNPPELLASLDQLLELFPNDPLLLRAKLATLTTLARRDDRLKLLAQVGLARDSDPVFWQLYAQELAADARDHDLAVSLLRRAIRCRPFLSGNLAVLANIRLSQRRFDEALELFRFAACLTMTDESLASSYFATARLLKQTETALEFLQQRFRRYGKQSGNPARTLFWALSQLERTPEAFVVLEQALALRPEDGELMTFAAEQWGLYGNLEEADQLQAGAEGRCPRAKWLKSAAALAWRRGDLAGALSLWRQVAEIEPLNLEAHSFVARLLAETDRLDACLEYLRQTCDRFPHNYPLHQLWIEWLRGEGAAAVEPIVRRILDIHPADAWARRELALVLSDQGRASEAMQELQLAFELEPENVSYFAVRGQVCARAGNVAEAKQAYRQAIRLSADNDFSIARLMELCESLAERRQCLALIKEELVRQVISGEGLLAYKRHAQAVLEAEELLGLLRQGLAERPDLWHAWSAVIGQLAEMGQREEAGELARKAADRFPLLPRIWLDLAHVCRLRGDQGGERSALQEAWRINPAWGEAACRLATAHERSGDAAEAKKVLEQAARRAPLDSNIQALLADVLWRQGEKEAALERIQQAVRCNPNYDWAWEKMHEWSTQVGRPEIAVGLARDLTQRRGGDAPTWLRLAKMLPVATPDAQRLAPLRGRAERLAALNKAIALNPQLLEAHDLKAVVLAEANRFDEALAACRPAGVEPVPITLRGRSAWVEAQGGNTQAAIEQMRELLRQDASYYWGWYVLTEWWREAGHPVDYLEAANQLVRLAPESPISYGFRGEAKLRMGDRAEAKEDLQRALAFDPAYEFGWNLLFDLQLADREFEGAAKTLAIIRQSANPQEADAREVRLAVRRRDQEKCLEVLRALCEQGAGPSQPLESAVAAMVEAGWAAAAERVLETALNAPTVHPCVGGLWVERCMARGSWRCRRRLPELVARGEIGRHALVAYANALADRNRWIRLRRLVRDHQGFLRETSLAWGGIGYALTPVEDYRRIVLWMEDWRRRSDAQPWMLTNLALALRALGRMKEASEVSRHALTLKEDHTSPLHRLWLAFDEALAGETQSARGRLAAIAVAGLDHYYQFLWTLVDVIVSVQQADVKGRSEAFAWGRNKLGKVWRTWRKENFRSLRASYRLGVRRLASDCGGSEARLWGLWRRLYPLVPGA